jgi:hypothetical protein
MKPHLFISPNPSRHLLSRLISRVNNIKLIVLIVCILLTLSPALSATVSRAVGLPSPWLEMDIGYSGAPNQPGNATYNNGTFTINGNGGTIGWTWEKFHYVFQPFSGDGSIVARIVSRTHRGGGTAKYGLMIREKAETWSMAQNASMLVTSDGYPVFQWRDNDGGDSSYAWSNSTVNLPIWLKLERTGTLFKGYYSTNGTSWTELGSRTLPLSTTLFIGLVGNSGDDPNNDDVVIDNVNVTINPISANVYWGSTQGTTTPMSYGLNGFHIFDPATAGNATYNQHLTYMKPGVIRYHSWDMLQDSASHPDGWLKTAQRTWDAQKVHNALSALTYNGAERMINIPGWPSWMDSDNDGYLDSNRFDDFATFCADLVRIANVTYPGHKITYWEITNERDDKYYTELVGNNQPDRMAELIDIYNRAARAMKAVDPTIKTGGPAVARPDLTAMIRKFVQGTVNQTNPITLDYFSFHFYASGSAGDTDTHIFNRLHNPMNPNVNSMSKHVADIRAILTQESPNRYIPAWNDEYNISWTWTTRDVRMTNNKGAVFDALAMVYSHLNGADVTTAWNEKDGTYGKMDDSYNRRITADVFQLMNNFFVGNRVTSNTASPGPVVTFAVVNPAQNRKSYLVINRSDNQHRVVTNFGGWTPANGTFTRYQVSAAGYTTGTDTYSALTAGVFVPPYSVTVYTMVDSSVVPTLTPTPVVASVTGNVNWASPTGITATEMSYGLNLFNGYNPAIAGNPGNAAYKEGLGYMNPGIVRYHRWDQMQGSTTNPDGWIINPTTANYAWDRTKINNALTGTFTYNPVRMMDITNWPAYMDDGTGKLRTDMFDAYAAFCAELVRIVNIEQGRGFLYWEVTNEKDSTYADAGKMSELVTIYNKAAVAMKAVDPTILVGGPAFHRPHYTGDVETFIAGTHQNLDFISYHTYQTGDPSSPNQGLFDAAAGLGWVTGSMKASIAKYTTRNILTFHDEYNIAWTEDIRMNNEVGAVFDALAMAAITQSGATGSMAWNEGDNWYGKLRHDTWVKRPAAHVYYLYNTFMRGGVVTSTSSDASKVYIYSVVNGTRKSFVLINRSEAEQRVQMSFNGWASDPSGKQFTAYQVTSTGMSTSTIGYSAFTAATGYVLPTNSVTLITLNDSSTTASPTASPTPTNTSVFNPPTNTPVAATNTPLATSTNTRTATNTPSPTNTATNTPTNTPQGPVSINDSVTGTGQNQFNYVGAWNYGQQSGAFLGDNHYSNTANASVTITFTGTQIRYYAARANNHGRVAVSINNGAETTIDLYASSRSDNVLVWTSPMLTNTTHTFKVRVLGTKQNQSSGFYGTVDRVEITGSTGPTSTATFTATATNTATRTPTSTATNTPSPTNTATFTPTSVPALTINDNVTGSGANQFNFVGAWNYSNQNGAYSGDNHWADSSAAYVTLTFTGTQISLYGAKDPYHGIGAVSIDGGAEVNVDYYATSRIDNTLIWTSPVLANTTHTFKLRVTGTKNAASAAWWVTVDRVDILTGGGTLPTSTPSSTPTPTNTPAGPTIVNDNTIGTGLNQFNYTGSWGYWNGEWSAYNSDNHYSNVTNNQITITFTGTQIRYYGATNNGNGIVAFSINNGAETLVDTYTPSRSDQVLLWTSPVLPAGTHTLKVRVTGTKNASSTDFYVTADKVEITH